MNLFATLYLSFVFLTVSVFTFSVENNGDYKSSEEDSQFGESNKFENIFSAISDMATRAKKTFSDTLLPKKLQQPPIKLSGGSRRILNPPEFRNLNQIQGGPSKFQRPKLEKITKVSSRLSGFRFPERFDLGDARSQDTWEENVIMDHADVETHTRRIPGKLRIVTQETTPATTSLHGISISTVKIVQPIQLLTTPSTATLPSSTPSLTLPSPLARQVLGVELPELTPLGVRLAIQSMLGGAGAGPIPGVAGTDYPVYSTVPTTAFLCSAQQWPGIYPDTAAGCQVFHICPPSAHQASFLCPNGTIFSQEHFVCDWWYNLDCEQQPALAHLNQALYQQQDSKGCDTLFCIGD